MMYQVEVRNNISEVIIETQVFYTEEEALCYIEDCIDEDMADGDYEYYNYYLNGELIN